MFLDLLRNRRSIRQFEKRPVEREKVALILEAALRSPSSRGLKPWEFIVVTDAAMLQQLAKAKTHGSSFIKNAPLAVIVCADTSKSDVWVEDASIAALILHLAAADLGLGSCWVQIRSRDHDDTTSSEAYVASLLGLREGRAVEAIVPIGYPAEQKNGHDHTTLLFERISYERAGNYSSPTRALY